MTKNQLIKKLQQIKGNPEILISSDSEGNVYNKLEEISYSPDLRFSEEDNDYSYGLTLYCEEDIGEDESGITKKQFNKLKKCIVFYP